MAFEQFLKRPPFGTQDYLAMLRKLLPKGPIWGFFSAVTEGLVYDTTSQESAWFDCESGSDDITINDTVSSAEEWASTPLGIFLSVIASELERFNIRCYDLVREMVPGLAIEMLPEWYYITVRDEYEAALVGDSQTDQQVLAHGKIFDEAQAATADWFESYGETLGFDITVNENPQSATPFICGVGRCGADRLGGRGAFSIIEITVNDAQPWANLELMQALFDRVKPAHVVITWLY